MLEPAATLVVSKDRNIRGKLHCYRYIWACSLFVCRDARHLPQLKRPFIFLRFFLSAASSCLATSSSAIVPHGSLHSRHNFISLALRSSSSCRFLSSSLSRFWIILLTMRESSPLKG